MIVKIKEDLYFNFDSVNLVQVNKFKSDIRDDKPYCLRIRYDGKGEKLLFEDKDKRDEAFERIIDYHD